MLIRRALRDPLPTVRSEFQVSELTAEDLPAIAWSGSPTHLAHVAHELRRAAVGEVAYLAVRDQQGSPVAIGLVDFVRRADGPEIRQLATRPDLQGMGLGSLLIAEAESRIASSLRRWAVIGVEQENARARRLYERLGYEAYERETDSWTAERADGSTYTHTASVVLMRKWLGAQRRR